MPSLDERVAYLEGRLEDHSGSVTALRDDLRLGIDRLDNRMDGLEARIDRLDDKVSRYFTWLVGIQIGVLIAVVGALLRR
jgi:hypothetical protein